MVAVGYVRCRRVTPHTTCALDILYTFTPEAMCFAANQLGLNFLKSTSGNLCNFSRGPDLVHLTAVSDIVCRLCQRVQERVLLLCRRM